MKFRLRKTGWLIPILYAFGALTLGFMIPRLPDRILPHVFSSMSANAAIGFYTAVASGMIALTGIVFSFTLLAIQFSATAYSPRLVLWVTRDPVVSHSIGVFTATFLYALSALAWVDRAGSGRVNASGEVMVVVLLVCSVIMFTGLIQRLGLLQVNRMLIFTGKQGRDVIGNLYPPLTAPKAVSSAEISQLPCFQTLLHRGDPRVVQAVNVSTLIVTASKNNCTIELVVSVGDAVLDATPILRLLGVGSPLPEDVLRSAIHLGHERTFEQDPKYALRLLVDIAIRALSPAINDPTTAVQALDQIEDLLIRLGHRRLEIGAFCDSAGDVRVLIAFPDWEDFLRLAFDEIQSYGASSIQVMRRMKAVVTDLISVLPEERQPALRKWQLRMQTKIERSFIDQDDKLEALADDRQGLG
jgi:uncharacterized membrane protein